MIGVRKPSYMQYNTKERLDSPTSGSANLSFAV